jgi:LysR family hydrogen peroxide-inducible transcriptional activator
MELYQLRYFLAVAETGNFTKAAGRSFVSQPSLSQQILNLEEEFGQKLFHRMGRKATLTDAGQVLLERARRMITEADNVLRELKEDPGLGCRVSVGAIPTVAHFILHTVVAYCRANDITIKLRSREDFRTSIVASVLEGELDWGVVSLPLVDPNLEITSLFIEPLLLAVSADHPLATLAKITAADLRDQNFIMAGGASTLTSQLMQNLSDEHAFTPNITHRCAQLSTLKSLTALGLGISILPRSARSPNDPAGLVYRRLSGPPLTREIALIRHRRRHLSKGAQLFAEAARAVVGPVAAGGTAMPFHPPTVLAT